MADQYDDWGDSDFVILALDGGDGRPPRRLKSNNGKLLVASSEPEAVTLQSGSTNISTLTPLTVWLDLQSYTEAIFAAWSDSAPDVTLVVETSEDGVHADVAQTTSVAQQGTQCSVNRGGDNVARYWRMSAHTDSPTFSPALVSWSVRAVPRG